MSLSKFSINFLLTGISVLFMGCSSDSNVEFSSQKSKFLVGNLPSSVETATAPEQNEAPKDNSVDIAEILDGKEVEENLEGLSENRITESTNVESDSNNPSESNSNDIESSDIESSDSESSDSESSDSESSDSESTDYEDTENESTDYEDTENESTDYEDTENESTDYEDTENESNNYEDTESDYYDDNESNDYEDDESDDSSVVEIPIRTPCVDSRYCRELDACAEHFGLKGELLYEESIHSAGNLIGQEVYSDRENNTGMTRVVYVGIEAKNANKSSLVATAPDTYYCIGAQFKNAKNFDVKMNCEDNVALDMQFSKKGQGGGSQSINYENLSCSK